MSKKKIVQVSFTDQEYRHLEEKSNSEGLSVSLFIRKKVLSDTEFQGCFDELVKKVGRIKAGTKFDIKSVFGTDWHNISRGTKLALGRAFYTYVKKGSLPSVVATEKDSANTQWYLKKSDDGLDDE